MLRNEDKIMCLCLIMWFFLCFFLILRKGLHYLVLAICLLHHVTPEKYTYASNISNKVSTRNYSWKFS